MQREPRPAILFSISTGSTYGMGNLLRCSSIANHIHDKCDIFFLLKEPLETNLTLNEHISYVTINETEKILPHCHTIIFDHQGPLNAKKIFKKYRKQYPEIPIIALDYFYLNDENVNVFINLSRYKETLFIQRNNNQYLYGLDYAIIRSKFKKFRFEITKESSELSNILITFGGEDIRNHTISVINWLERNVRFPLSVKIILGPLFGNRGRVKEIIERSLRHVYKISESVNNIASYMCNSDLIFCGGGTTILESAYLGKPVIALPQNEMERIFLAEFVNNNFLPSNVEESIPSLKATPCYRLFVDNSLRNQFKRNGMRLVDGNGADRISRIILQQAFRYLKKQASCSQ